MSHTPPHNLPTGNITILFTDMEDSTVLNHALGNDLYATQLREPHFACLRACLTDHNGHEIGTPAGDSLMAVFQSPDDALACAKSIQLKLENPPLTCHHGGQEYRVKVRIGLHRAERHMTPNASGLYGGEDLNFAARVMGQGKGGQILVSENCHKSAGSRQRYTFHRWEGRYLKGYDHPEDLHEMLWYDGQKPQEPGSQWVPAWMLQKRDAFIGRDNSIAFVVNWLKGSNPLLILHGPGGVGKSRLGVESILRVIPHFAGNVFGAALDEEFGSSPESVTPEQLAASIARAVNAPKEVTDTPLQLLSNHLKSRPKMLFFLDNGESVFNEETLRCLARLVKEAPNVRWLVTTRHYPGLTTLAEDYNVPLLPLPESDAEMETSDLYRLFKARVEQQHPAPDISDTHSLRRVLTLTDGFPLAVELVAARRRFQTLDKIASGLETSRLDYQRTLKKSRQYSGESERHESMESCIHWSVEMLPPDEQKLYARAGIFAFDFDETAAQEIAEIPLETLMGWQALHLVEYSEPNNASRYLLLPVFREYARQRQQRDFADETPVLEQRYTAYYATLCENNGNVNLPAQKATLDREWRNALDAAEIAARHVDWPALSRIAYGLRDYLYLSIYGVEAARLQEMGEKIAKQVGAVLGEANCIQSLGNIALARSDHEEARRRYEQALPMFQQVGAVLGEANCIRSLGQISQAQNQPDAAREQYQLALELYQRIPEPYSIGVTHYFLSQIAARPEERKAHQSTARTLWTKIGLQHLLILLDPDEE